MKIRPVGAELFHADGRTDTTKLIVAFRNFVNTPKTVIKLSYLFTATIDSSKGDTDSNSTKKSVCILQKRKDVFVVELIRLTDVQDSYCS